MKDLTLDFETYYDPATYTLKKMSELEYVRDPRFRALGVGVKWGEEPAVYYERPEEFFATVNWATTRVIGHNLNFDALILAERYGIVAGAYADTRFLSYAVNGLSIVQHGLGFLAAHHGLGEKGVMDQTNVAALAEYCKQDVELTWKLYKKLMEKFPKSSGWDLDWATRVFVTTPLKLDAEILKVCHADEMKRRAEFFTTRGWERAVFSSNAKFAALLTEKGYDVPLKVSPRTELPIPALAQGDEAFQEMLASTDPALAELCEARVVAKSNLLETRSMRLLKIAEVNPRWGFALNFSGAKQTHRHSGNKAGGGNPQNFTRDSDLRRAVSATHATGLTVVDLSQAEARGSATLSCDRFLLSLFATGDPYSEMASRIYGYKVTKTTHPIERRVGKETLLGLSYGMGHKKFASRCRIQGIEMSEERAREIVELYRDSATSLVDYWNYLDKIIALMSRNYQGSLRNLPAVKIDGTNIILPSGLIMRYPDLRGEMVPGRRYMQWTYSAYKAKTKVPQRQTIYGGKLLENLMQSLIGEAEKAGIRRLHAAGYSSAGQVHDEALVPTDTDRSAHIAALMTEAPAWWPQIRLKAEAHWGPNWLAAK